MPSLLTAAADVALYFPNNRYLAMFLPDALPVEASTRRNAVSWMRRPTSIREASNVVVARRTAVVVASALVLTDGKRGASESCCSFLVVATSQVGRRRGLVVAAEG